MRIGGPLPRQVVEEPSDSLNIVAHIAERSIARLAKKSSDTASFVVVVDGHVLDG